MKTIEKVLFKKDYESSIAYGYRKEHKVRTQTEVTMYFDFKRGLRFAVSSGNVSNCSRNIFKAFIRTLEHESIGMAKYDQMKCDARKCGIYNRLDIK